jgi:hypothetical protein
MWSFEVPLLPIWLATVAFAFSNGTYVDIAIKCAALAGLASMFTFEIKPIIEPGCSCGEKGPVAAPSEPQNEAEADGVPGSPVQAAADD